MVGPESLIVVVSQHGDSWSLPKGRIDSGESSEQAALREIYEESGLNDVEIIEELDTYKRPRIGKDGQGDAPEIKTITIFLCSTDQKQLNPVDPENPEARWVEPEKVAEMLTHEKDKEFIKRVLPRVKEFISQRK